ncbi:MAG: hypothetical protein NC827_08395 [Candidatus Omnitrophica bacterium]|nr:hypothetical protein [Candidatus Omnitrophota bacterium]MCM8803309.1 hypothetical protein [Candidatus Omnitrophota bacterium]
MIKIGDYLGKGKNKKKVVDIVQLSNDWILVKTENSKSKNDFKVITIYEPKKLKFYTPKHAHFAIDFYGKLCHNPENAERVFRAIIEVWQGNSVKSALEKYRDLTNLPGYNLDYILYALKWILEQEDINFQNRPKKLQQMLDNKCKLAKVSVPENRKGSQLAISLLCDIFLGTHPVEALLSANLDIIPRLKR